MKKSEIYGGDLCMVYGLHLNNFKVNVYLSLLDLRERKEKN